MANIIDGKAVAARKNGATKRAVEALQQQGLEVCLAVVIVGDDPASRVYIEAKKRSCATLGIRSIEFALDTSTTEQQLLALIEQLNSDEKVHGILVQLPLPKQIDSDRVIAAIVPTKDVDAFHPQNVGKIMIGTYDFVPCTPAGCMELIATTGVTLQAKHAVVVGRSNIVGKPMAMLLLQQNATVTICHSKTENLIDICRTADILVVAVGKAGFVRGDMVKPGAVVIDVGIHRLANAKLCGDVDFASAAQKASHITPVPGGVGPMTIATLMANTVRAAELHSMNGTCAKYIGVI